MAHELDVEELIASLEPGVRRAFLAVIVALRDEFSVEKIFDLLLTGRIYEFEAAITVQAAKLGKTVIAVYTAGAESASAFINVSYDGVNVRAVAEMQAMRDRIIREMLAQQIRVVRQILDRGVREGTNPLVTARELRDSIGLTARQDEAVANYRRLLEQGEAEALTRRLRDRRFDGATRRAIGGEPLSPAEVDRMVARYRSRAIALRAETIARTETLAAAHGGTEQMWNQAVTVGGVDARRLVRTWVTSGLPNRRDHHITMQGQKRPYGVPFTSGNGNLIRYPGDLAAPLSETANCACVVTTRIASSIEGALVMLAA